MRRDAIAIRLLERSVRQRIMRERPWCYEEHEQLQYPNAASRRPRALHRHRLAPAIARDIDWFQDLTVTFERYVGRRPLGMYLCEIEHWYTHGRKFAILKRVDEDDCNWRFPDDNSELSYDWTVINAQRL